jgi:flagellar biosynthesis/type III secretory pathway M-ring protein FliF/YscJ
MLASLPGALPDLVFRCRSWLIQRRAPAFAAVACALMAFVLFADANRRTARVPLFSVPLHPTQALEVEKALLLWNEPFTSDAQHTQIFVRASRRRDVALRLTLAGLPHGYVPTSADVMQDPPPAFAPQSVIDDRRRAGIQGDLVWALRRLPGIADASVVIAPAQDDPLAGVAASPPSASVQVLMQPGVHLTATESEGIKRYVAAAYPGLTPQRVVLVDDAGLAAATPAPDTLAVREMRVQNAIQTALDAVFGLGAAVVRVSLRPPPERFSIHRTVVTPHGVVESDRSSESGADAAKHFLRQRDHSRFAFDTTEETRSTVVAGAVAHLSVAVFLDAHRVGVAAPEQVASLVRAAAGADLSRGDEVVVRALNFSQPPSVDGRDAFTVWRRRTWVRAAVVAAFVGIVGTAGLAYRTLCGAAPDAEIARRVHRTLRAESPQTAAYVLGALPARLRSRILAEYHGVQRDAILLYLRDHSRHG